MRNRDLLTLCFALGCAVFIGYVNVNANEVQMPMLLIIFLSGMLGFIQPKSAWRWGLIIGLSVPLSYFIAFAVNYKVVDPPHLPITTAILIIPALVATYIGVGVNRVIAEMRQSPAH